MRKLLLSTSAILIGLSGCATMPLGPRVAVMPAVGKPLDVFVGDDHSCRSFAEYQTGGSAQEAADNSLVNSGLVGTVIGAAAGTAIGALAGNIGVGAIAGAGLGALQGTAMGAEAGYHSGRAVQQQYDIAYQQCMYAKGNQVAGVASQNMNAPSNGAPYGSAYPPPPPAGYAPPPPPAKR